jgi:glycyl-tRNA synthetase alpha chain
VTFQKMIFALERFWADQGCVIVQPYDLEVGAGTFHPATFLRVLGPEPWRVGYVQPSRRPKDARYGENPNRLYRHYQYQVILKPSPDDIQDTYLASLAAIGIDLAAHDIRFEEDDWQSPTLGASGVGWQVTMDGTEITQFTYFQQVGGYDLNPISVELTYGLERLAMAIQGAPDFGAIEWTDGITYGEVHRDEERQHSLYSYSVASIEGLLDSFRAHEREVGLLLEHGLVYPAYEYVLKCSHTFNLLEARGAIGVAERTNYIARIRKLARGVATRYIDQLNDGSGTGSEE